MWAGVVAMSAPTCLATGHPAILAACIARADDATQQRLYADLARQDRHDVIRFLLAEASKRARAVMGEGCDGRK
jgi:hypothetical protein